jgi:hypothetical protein
MAASACAPGTMSESPPKTAANAVLACNTALRLGHAIVGKLILPAIISSRVLKSPRIGGQASPYSTIPASRDRPKPDLQYFKQNESDGGSVQKKPSPVARARDVFTCG